MSCWRRDGLQRAQERIQAGACLCEHGFAANLETVGLLRRPSPLSRRPLTRSNGQEQPELPRAAVWLLRAARIRRRQRPEGVQSAVVCPAPNHNPNSALIPTQRRRCNLRLNWPRCAARAPADTGSRSRQTRKAPVPKRRPPARAEGAAARPDGAGKATGRQPHAASSPFDWSVETPSPVAASVQPAPFSSSVPLIRAAAAHAPWATPGRQRRRSGQGGAKAAPARSGGGGASVVYSCNPYG